MARVISIHEYDLKPGADVAAFEQAVRDAERQAHAQAAPQAGFRAEDGDD